MINFLKSTLGYFSRYKTILELWAAISPSLLVSRFAHKMLFLKIEKVGLVQTPHSQTHMHKKNIKLVDSRFKLFLAHLTILYTDARDFHIVSQYCIIYCKSVKEFLLSLSHRRLSCQISSTWGSWLFLLQFLPLLVKKKVNTSINSIFN